MNTIYKYIIGGFFIVFITLMMSQLINYFFPNNRTPQEFQYKQHTYIYFPNKGLVHSPDCKHCQLVFD